MITHTSLEFYKSYMKGWSVQIHPTDELLFIWSTKQNTNKLNIDFVLHIHDAEEAKQRCWKNSLQDKRQDKTWGDSVLAQEIKQFVINTQLLHRCVSSAWRPR